MIVQPTTKTHKAGAMPSQPMCGPGHEKAAYGPWFPIASLLSALPCRVDAAGCTRSGHRSVSSVAAQVSAVPVGNHGENKTSTASTAQEVRS